MSEINEYKQMRLDAGERKGKKITQKQWGALILAHERTVRSWEISQHIPRAVHIKEMKRLAGKG